MNSCKLMKSCNDKLIIKQLTNTSCTCKLNSMLIQNYISFAVYIFVRLYIHNHNIQYYRHLLHCISYVYTMELLYVLYINIILLYIV